MSHISAVNHISAKKQRRSVLALAAFFVVVISGMVFTISVPTAFADNPTTICVANGTTSIALLHPGCGIPPPPKPTPTPPGQQPPTKTINVPQATTHNIKTFTDGLEFYALIFCVAAIFLSAILWAVGSKGRNPGQELTGKRGLLVAISAAFLIGTVPVLMNFMTGEAKQADQVGVLTAPYPQAGAGSSSSSGSSSNCSTADRHNGVAGC